MKYLIVLAIVATVALAGPLDNAGFVDVTQSSLGSYKFHVDTKDSSQHQERSVDGSIVGEYTIPGDNGVPLTFKYTSGVDGFKIVSGPLPVAPVDTNVPVPESPEIFAVRNVSLF